MKKNTGLWKLIIPMEDRLDQVALEACSKNMQSVVQQDRDHRLADKLLPYLKIINRGQSGRLPRQDLVASRLQGLQEDIALKVS